MDRRAPDPLPASTAVVVAVLTYRRNDALSRLLPRLTAQCRDLDRLGLTTSSVLVVDNDPDQGARRIVESCGGEVRYAHEASPGIAAGRARAVEEADQDDVLIFIDDDEVPGPEWLVRMWQAWWTAGRPAGVAGRVTPTFHGSRDPWIDAGEFFVRPARVSGTLVPAASSANLLLDLGLLRELGLNFDRALGLAGGEDTLLTRTLTAAGHRLVWCHEAEVIDIIPPERMRRRWVLRRAFHHGAVESRVALALAGRRRAARRARLLLGGAGRMLAGSARAAAGYLSGRTAWQARGARLTCRGAGLVAGASGRNLVEYRREPSPSRPLQEGSR